MSSPPLQELWAQIAADLQEAANLLPTAAQSHRLIVEFREFLDCNELELACDMLEDYGCDHTVPNNFWFILSHAAARMKLNDRAAQYRALGGTG